MYNRCITDIDEYTDFIFHVLGKETGGCVVLKCALAEIALWLLKATKEQAQRAMVKDPEPSDIKRFQDYIFNYICKVAA